MITGQVFELTPIRPNYNALISKSILENACLHGLRIKSTTGLSDESYYLHMVKELGFSPSSFHKKEMRRNLQNNKSNLFNRKITSIEITEVESGQFAGFISMSIYRYRLTLEINYFAITKQFQGRGYGQYLMQCAISIANTNKLEKITLEAETGSEGFYEKKIGMRKISDHNSLRDVFELNLKQDAIFISERIKAIDLSLPTCKAVCNIPHVILS